MIKIEVDYKKTEKLKERLKEYFHPPSAKIYVHDLVSCPLKCYNRLKDVEFKPSKKTLMYWMIGKIFHQIIQEKYDLIEQEKEYFSVLAHIDIVEDLYPIEIKSTRQKILYPSYIPETWIKQLLFYMLISEKTEGWLFTLDINSTDFMVWKISVDDLNWVSNMFFDSYKRLMEGPLIPRILECSLCPYDRSCKKTRIPNGVKHLVKS